MVGTDGPALLAGLGELRPVGRDRRVGIDEPAIDQR